MSFSSSLLATIYVGGTDTINNNIPIPVHKTIPFVVDVRLFRWAQLMKVA